MPNPLFNVLGGKKPQQRPPSMMEEFARFCGEMRGKDPDQMIQGLLSGGQVTQTQYDQACQMAKQMHGIFAPMMGKR